jgi:flagellar basal body-associated protein FliL
MIGRAILALLRWVSYAAVIVLVLLVLLTVVVVGAMYVITRTRADRAADKGRKGDPTIIWEGTIPFR